MSHDMRRSQKRRIAKLRAKITGQQWLTNAAKRAPKPLAPVAAMVDTGKAYVFTTRFTLPDVSKLDTRDSKSYARAMSAGRFHLRQSVSRTSHRDVDQTFLVVG